MNYEIYELADYLCNNKIATDFDEEELENQIYDKYNIDFENFYKLINDLIPLCNISRSAITDNYYQGFATDEFWLYKEKIK